MLLPVCTLSPVSSSDICTDLPFSRVTVAVDGKQPVIAIFNQKYVGKNEVKWSWKMVDRYKKFLQYISIQIFRVDPGAAYAKKWF